jgi:hypothetical protein
MSYIGSTPKFDSVEGDNIKVDGNTISSTNENGDINLSPNGSGKVSVPTKTQGDSSTAAASTAFVSGAISSGDFVKADGSKAMSGNLNLGSKKITNLAAPENANDAVNKQYLDGVAAGLATRPAVKAATTADLGGVYSNGALNDGVGATLNLGPLASLDIDGITSWSQYDGILVKNQSPSLENGRYYISQIGDASTDWILTRCVTCDQSTEIPASYMFVQFGSTNSGKGFVAIVGTSAGADPNAFEIGYDNIVFTQFSGAGESVSTNPLEVFNVTVEKTSDDTSALGIAFFKAPKNLTISYFKAQLFEKGSVVSGTLSIDVKKNTNPQSSGMSSIFSVLPSFDFSSVSDYAQSSGTLSTTSVIEGEFLRLDLPSIPANFVGSIQIVMYA